MVGAIAQFEREIMLERQREGIAKAKAAGKYKGRAPTARAKAMLKGGMGATEVARNPHTWYGYLVSFPQPDAGEHHPFEPGRGALVL
jgi:DNA invertase Pin-like site-specific DNA recombinase